MDAGDGTASWLLTAAVVLTPGRVRRRFRPRSRACQGGSAKQLRNQNAVSLPRRAWIPSRMSAASAASEAWNSLRGACARPRRSSPSQLRHPAQAQTAMTCWAMGGTSRAGGLPGYAQPAVDRPVPSVSGTSARSSTALYKGFMASPATRVLFSVGAAANALPERRTCAGRACRSAAAVQPDWRASRLWSASSSWSACSAPTAPTSHERPGRLPQLHPEGLDEARALRKRHARQRTDVCECASIRADPQPVWLVIFITLPDIHCLLVRHRLRPCRVGYAGGSWSGAWDASSP